MFRFCLAFDVVTALVQNVLRQHSEMSAKRHSRRHNRFHLRQNIASSFGLHKFRAGGDETL